MRMMILAGAVLALSACGGGESETNTANTMGADNMMVDPMMDPNMTTDMNGAMGANMSGGDMTGANGAMDANTANTMMAVDANTNSPDANLANGL
ncbi:MAG TPA: hypothetical protein VGC35_05545 [Allosphingosinicella sp.]